MRSTDMNPSLHIYQVTVKQLNQYYVNRYCAPVQKVSSDRLSLISTMPHNPYTSIFTSSLILTLLYYLPQSNNRFPAHLCQGNTGCDDTFTAPQGGWLLHDVDVIRSGNGGTCWSLQERHLYFPPSDFLYTADYLAALRDYEAMHAVGRVSEAVNRLPRG